MSDRMKDLLSKNLPQEELITLVVLQCANIAYELSDDMEEGERLAKQICDTFGV